MTRIDLKTKAKFNKRAIIPQESAEDADYWYILSKFETVKPVVKGERRTGIDELLKWKNVDIHLIRFRLKGIVTFQ